MSQAKETFMADREREMNGLPIIYAGMTKTDISIAAKSAVDNLLESGNTLKIAEQVAALKTFLKEVEGDDRYTKAVREEVEKYGKAYTAGSGAKIELAETGTKYDFSQCGDPRLAHLQNELADIETEIEDRKKFLKALPVSGMPLLDETTGEMVTVYPPSKSSTSSFKITLKK